MEFRVFGGVEAHSSAGPVDLGPVRQRTVLAALLVDVNRTVSADQLVQRVWGDSPPLRAKETLYSYLSRLRRLLPDSAAALPRRHGGYAVATDERAVDLHHFRHLLERARRATDDQSAVDEFRQALALWRGEPFAGIDTPWFNTVRDALVRERLAAELDSHDRRLRLGDHAALLPVLAELSAAHPLDERVAAQYMLALHRCGRQADALAHYRRLRVTLAEELGIDPGRDLQRLHESMLAGDPGPIPATPPAGARGTASAPRESAPVPLRRTSEPAWTVQCQLPLDIPGFVGRAAAIRDLEDELTSPLAVPVVLSGSPGVGKTALAVHLGHRLRGAFPDGQWYVRLSGGGDRPPRDPAEVLSALLRSAGADARDIPVPLEDLAAAFRSTLADRKVLLVLDNAADAEQVRPLLPGTAGVAVLVTSRSDLRGLTASHAARGVLLDVLAPAEAHTLLDGALGAGRVTQEPEAAARLAELCARLPLALRIVAANLAARPGRSLAAYTDGLSDEGRLGKLSIAGDREAAVRTAFDRSYAALAPDAARLFRFLGLLPGPDFTVEAAAALLGVELPDAERLLDLLITAGLVQHTSAERFQFHDLLRLYAAENAAADPGRAAAWRRVCDWYLTTVDAATAFEYTGSVQLPRARADSSRFADRHQALAWLEAERAGLVALITRTARDGPAEISWLLADQLRAYFYRRRHTTEWKVATEAALAAAERDGEVLAQAVLRYGLGLLLQHSGHTEAALDVLLAAEEGYRSTGFTLGQVSILTNLAIHYGQRGQMRQALARVQSSGTLLRDLDRPVLLSTTLNIMGLIHTHLGEFDAALDRTTEAIQTSLTHGHTAKAASPLINRALAHHGLGHYGEALADGTEALRLCQEHQNRSSMTGAHEILARVHRDTGLAELALTHAEQGLRSAREVGDLADEAECLITLGSVYRTTDRPDVATAHLEEALRLARSCGFRHQEALSLALLARARLAVGAVDLAMRHAERALALARERDLRPTEHHARTALAAIARATGHPNEAADHLARAREIERETGYHPPPMDETCRG